MGTRDPRTDAYVSARADFARPILESIRERVHAACPDITETLKWSLPTFLHKGAILCGMAAFKDHAAFNLWRGEEVLGGEANREAMGVLGRLRSVDDLPDEPAFAAMLARAAALIESGAKPARAAKTPRPDPIAPPELEAALALNPAASAAWTAFPPGCRREYLEWIEEGKRPETRASRIARTVAQAAEGKKLHWKYEDC